MSSLTVFTTKIVILHTSISKARVDALRGSLDFDDPSLFSKLALSLIEISEIQKSDHPESGFLIMLNHFN